MAKFVEMDEQVTLSKQMEDDVGGSVILINKFTVKAEEVDQFLKAWIDDATVFKEQPGFISTQLHRGIAGSGVSLSWQVVVIETKSITKGLQTQIHQQIQRHS